MPCLLQTAGYMVQYNGLTYATVRGAGHQVISCYQLGTTICNSLAQVQYNTSNTAPFRQT